MPLNKEDLSFKTLINKEFSTPSRLFFQENTVSTLDINDNEVYSENISPTPATAVSDGVAKTVGSWTFIIIQSLCIIAWIIFNTHNGASAWDAYPFILLNLVLLCGKFSKESIFLFKNQEALFSSSTSLKSSLFEFKM
jgi:uncharacterized membrane protein